VPSLRLAGVQVALVPFATPLAEVLLWSTLLHAAFEQSWNEIVPVSGAPSESEKVAESCGVTLMRAPTLPSAGTAGKVVSTTKLLVADQPD